jgi:hypothetical protein
MSAERQAHGPFVYVYDIFDVDLLQAFKCADICKWFISSYLR